MNKSSNKLIILVAIFFVFVTGCLRNYFQNEKEYKDEIKEYIEEKIGLKKYKLSDNYETVKGEDTYTDKIWTVEDENGIKFHVIDDFYWANVSLSNRLENDYDKTVFLKYYEELDKKDSIKLEDVTEYTSMLVCSYSNKNELVDCFDSLRTYYDFYYDKGFNLDITCKMLVNSDYNSSSQFMSSYGKLSNLDEEFFNKSLLNFYTYSVFHQDSKVISEMTDEELNKVINSPDVQKIIGTKYIGANNSISFETLYLLLKEKKYRVSGDKTNFTVYDKSGNKYQFSTKFYNTVASDYKNFYYLKNNEQVRCSDYIITNTVYDLFALSITLENNK